MNSSSEARITFGDEIVEYLSQGRDWLDEVTAALPGGSVPGGMRERALEELDRLIEDTAEFVAATNAVHPDVVGRCPVVIECSCRSFTTMRSILLAASTLAEDLEDDLEFKQERLKHADGRSTDLQGIPMILRVHRPRSWIWPTVLRLLDMIRSGLDHASFATCAHCGAPDIVVAADDDAGAPAKDDERAPGAFAVASATAADPAWIAFADGVAEQVRWANAVATSLIEGERGFLGALRYLTGGPGRILSFRRLRDQLQEAVAETDVLLAVARRIDPDSPGRNQAAIPCPARRSPRSARRTAPCAPSDRPSRPRTNPGRPMSIGPLAQALRTGRSSGWAVREPGTTSASAPPLTGRGARWMQRMSLDARNVVLRMCSRCSSARMNGRLTGDLGNGFGGLTLTRW